MSRLFESFGDGADDKDKMPAGSPLSGELDALVPEEPFGESATARDIAANAPMDETIDDAPIVASSAKRVTSLNEDGEPNTASAAGAKSAAAGASSGIDVPLPYDIPDFAKDERDLESYEDAKRRHQRQQMASAETAISTSFGQKREQLQREIKNGRTFEEERRATAMVSTRAYANAYPVHVDKRGIQPPSFMENLFSFGRAGRLYRAAFIAAEALDQLRQAMRKREEQLGALDEQMKRAIVLKEEAIKKHMESQAGIDEFNERPEIKALWKRCEKARKERADYAKRLERNGVTDEEQRDRAMAEQKLTFTELPVMGGIIAKVARFGRLSYFQLRDLQSKESLLSYDPRLDPLRNSVFDIYSIAGAVAAKLKRTENGTAFRVADHFKACWRNQDKAEELYGQHRSLLREDRGLEPMTPRNENEAEILDRLAGLASQVDGQASAAQGSPLSQ